jgi:predicted esterase
MERSRVRRFGVKAGVCALSCVSLLGGSNVGATPFPNSIELEATSDQPGVVLFPARVPGPRPITVLLHGMCGDAARACGHFADQVTQTSNLVCPRASARCTGGGASWPDKGVAEAVEAAVTRAKSALPEVDETHGRTLIGYSMGAYRAASIAQASARKYPRVMLIGARVYLDQARLAQNGTERVLLCAGGWDMTHDPMQREADRMRHAGFQARFLDLGPVGHAFTPSFAEYLTQALSWLSGA